MAANENPDFESPPRRDVGREHATLMAWWRQIGERQPILAVGAAAALGTVLGGIVFSRWGRLAVFVVAGYVANELWHSERRIEIDELIAKLSSTHDAGVPRRSA
jgi:hypothetical protein